MLSKSRFVKGWQCHKLLWWTVHEPDAVELQPDRVLQDLFDQGRQVGEAARERFPGGVLIDIPYTAREARVEATRTALDFDAPAVFEATFVAQGTSVAIDVLERQTDREGHRLIEVKASNSQKDEHIPDAAVQAYIAAACGVQIRGAEVMHLNPEFRNPDSGDLLARTDVTQAVADFLPNIPDELARQQAMLDGPLPDVPIGRHCFEPRDCPFLERCWPDSRDHIRYLYNVGKVRAAGYLERGIEWIKDIPKGDKLNFTQTRQLKAMAENRIVVEPTLAGELQPLLGVERIGFLDFETIARAIPVWPGMAPWQAAAAQFSYHERQPDGRYTHAAFLAEGPLDARPPLVAAMLEATAKADKVVTYSSFEKTRIRELQQSVPEAAGGLAALERKLVDLLPIVRNCVYHPDFKGSFSLKFILHPLVPELSYDDLVIVDGRIASVEIARLLFVADRIPKHERDRVRQDLLNYCERDTWATVKLLERLRELAGV